MLSPLSSSLVAIFAMGFVGLGLYARWLTVEKAQLSRRLTQVEQARANFNDGLIHTRDAMHSFRDIFDHYSSYTTVPAELNEVMVHVSGGLGAYFQQLPYILPTLRKAYLKGPEEFQEQLEYQVRQVFKDYHYEGLKAAVRKANDPVLNELWAIRSPHALAEMLRHSLFLSFGYGHAVAGDWTSGVQSISIPQRAAAGDTNWGATSLQGLRERHARIWQSPELPKR